MKNISKKNDIKVIYLDQFAASGMFESDSSEWLKIKNLIFEGVKKDIFVCPLSTEHFIETSQKEQAKAAALDSDFYGISGGLAYKPELFITSQLMVSLIRNNNITLRTYLNEGVRKNIMSEDVSMNAFCDIKKILTANVSEAAELPNMLRDESRRKNIDLKTRKLLMASHKFISVFRFIERLEHLLDRKQIVIRAEQFSSGAIPNWIDLVIFQLLNKHKVTEKEIKMLKCELRQNGFDNIPTLDIRSSLSAIISVYSKKETVNDQIDIMRISSGLPVSDILLTDKQRKNEIVELELDKKYFTEVFNGTKQDLEKLISTLERLNA